MWIEHFLYWNTMNYCSIPMGSIFCLFVCSIFPFEAMIVKTGLAFQFYWPLPQWVFVRISSWIHLSHWPSRKEYFKNSTLYPEICAIFTPHQGKLSVQCMENSTQFDAELWNPVSVEALWNTPRAKVQGALRMSGRQNCRNQRIN